MKRKNTFNQTERILSALLSMIMSNVLDVLICKSVCASNCLQRKINKIAENNIRIGSRRGGIGGNDINSYNINSVISAHKASKQLKNKVSESVRAFNKEMQMHILC